MGDVAFVNRVAEGRTGESGACEVCGVSEVRQATEPGDSAGWPLEAAPSSCVPDPYPRHRAGLGAGT